jgi:hypothetical protein
MDTRYAQSQKIGNLYNLKVFGSKKTPVYYYHWIDTSAGGILVSDGIIRPIVSVSALMRFIRYIYY